MALTVSHSRRISDSCFVFIKRDFRCTFQNHSSRQLTIRWPIVKLSQQSTKAMRRATLGEPIMLLRVLTQISYEECAREKTFSPQILKFGIVARAHVSVIGGIGTA